MNTTKKVKNKESKDLKEKNQILPTSKKSKAYDLLKIPLAEAEDIETPTNFENPALNSSKVLNPVTFPNPPSSQQASVNVICRFRPLNDKERNISDNLCCEFVDKNQVIVKSSGENNTYKFNFDSVFDYNCTQQEVYDSAAKPIIESVLEGFNGTIFAYGQTSSGKTFTMQGVLENPEKEGIIPRMIRSVFNHILHASSDVEFTVKVSMIEIYMEKIKDLIEPDRNNLQVREEKAKGLYIEDLSEHYVSSDDEVLEIMRAGSENRAIAATNMNEHSSRSHSIFIMSIHQQNTRDLSAKTGKLYLVDLAGSEKISKTGATGMTLEEAKTINRSLTTLGMVINALTDGKSTHVPYRESKLTRVLQESLGGNARTCLIITCSPSSYNEAETLSTLRFGLRAKKIKNKPKINKEVTVQELKIEIDRLALELEICYRRIKQLETYIQKHNLPIPALSDKIDILTNTADLLPTNHHNISNALTDGNTLPDFATKPVIEKEIRYINTNEDVNDDDLKESLGIGIMVNQLKTERENYKQTVEKYDLLNKNYEQVIEKVTNLEEEKKNKNNEMSDETKEFLNKQILVLKQQYEERENELNDKIMELEDIIKEKEDELMLRDEEWKRFSENKAVDTTNEINFLNSFLKNIDSIINRNDSSDVSVDLKIDLINLMNKYSMHKQLLPKNKELLKDPFSKEESKKDKNKDENVKKLIFKSLEEKSAKIAQLDIENKELRERVKILESKINPDEKNFIKKIVTLEKNLEQVKEMFQEVLTEKSVVKIHNQILYKRCKEREKELGDLREQLRFKDDKLAFYQKSTLKNFAPTNVVKVIKGGHLKTSSYFVQPETSGMTTDTRILDENDDNLVKKGSN